MNKKICFALLLCILIHTVNSQTVFPLRVSDNKRYFVDRNNKPFLYHAETGWQIYNRLTTEEARIYLIKRKQQGFNTIQTMIAFTPEDINRYGEKPFHNNNDFSKPNEALEL